MAETRPYSERIPAAIADGEERLGGADWVFLRFDVHEQVVITAGEVAMAEALHKTYRALNAEAGGEHWPDALVAFTETMEALSDG